MEPYRSHFPHAGMLLPQTNRVSARVLVMPTGTAAGPDEIAGACNILRLAVANGPVLRQAIEPSGQIEQFVACFAEAQPYGQPPHPLRGSPVCLSLCVQ